MNLTKINKLTTAYWVMGLFILANGGGVLQANEMNLNSDSIGVHEVTHGSLLLTTDIPNKYIPSPLLETNVTMKISGMVARVKVSQQFRNVGSEWAEGVYVFPLPEQAAVDHMRLRIGDRVIEGKIKEREQAKKIYQNAKLAGKRASLVEQERPNLFTTSVANIAPGEQVSIEIEYLQTINYTDNQFSLRFPMAITPRYIPRTIMPTVTDTVNINDRGWTLLRQEDNAIKVVDAARITPSINTEDEGAINPVSIYIQLATGFQLSELSASYHAIQKQQDGHGTFHITLEKGEVASDRDFELIWKPATHDAPVAAMFRQHYEGDDYALLMVMPPQIANMKEAVAPREFVFIIDISGSMSGDSIAQAKAGLKLALQHLTERDRFNIIWFNSSYGSVFPDSRIATPLRIAHAERFIERLEANGGTKMLPALKRALTKLNDFKLLRQVIFLTDGAVGNEDALFKIINNDLGNSRLFTVGIGSAPNSYFMRKAAERGRGTFTYIGNTHEVLEKMEPLLMKLSQPALTDLKLVWQDGTVIESLPSLLPDLYLGEPVVLALKAAQFPESLTLQGNFGSTPWQTKVSLTGGRNGKGIAGVWARRKIGSLMDKRLTVHDEISRNRFRDRIIDVALKHHLVSKFTSLVAVDVTPIRLNNPFGSHKMKTQLPKGMNQQKVFGMAKTATPAMLNIFIGLFLLLLGILCWPLLSRTSL